MPIRKYFKLISFTDSDIYPASGICPKKFTDLKFLKINYGTLTDTDTDL